MGRHYRCLRVLKIEGEIEGIEQNLDPIVLRRPTDAGLALIRALYGRLHEARAAQRATYNRVIITT